MRTAGPSSSSSSAPKLYAALALAAGGVAAYAAFDAWREYRRREQLKAAPVVKELLVFPIKGCRGISLQQAEVTSFGIKYDREWVVLKEGDPSTVMTLRNCPKLARVEVRIVEATNTLELKSAGDTVSVPLQPDPAAVREAVDFALWGIDGRAVDEGDAAASFLRAVTGQKVRLYHTVGPRDHTKTRMVPGAEDPSLVPPNHHVLAHDLTSLMLVSEETVKLIRNETGDDAMDAHRLRPNIVVAAGAPLRELTYRRLDLGDIRILFSKYCTRCSVPTVLPDGTLHKKGEPTRTLRERFSAVPLHIPDGPAQPVAGVNVFHDGTGVIRVGDVLQVVETAAPPTLGKAPPK